MNVSAQFHVAAVLVSRTRSRYFLDRKLNRHQNRYEQNYVYRNNVFKVIRVSCVINRCVITYYGLVCPSQFDENNSK